MTSTSTETQAPTRTDERIDERTVPVTTDGGDHERFAHYADKDKITEAMVLGTPVVALCGKVWVPSRDPKRYPVCPECQRLLDLGPEGRMREWKDRSSSGN